MIEVEHKIVITLELTRDDAKAFRDDLKAVSNPREVTRDLEELLTRNVGIKRAPSALEVR